MNFIKRSISKLKDTIKARFAKTLGIKTTAEYKAELEKFLNDIELLGDTETIDELVADMGIAGTAREYQQLNSYFKSYYKLIIKEVEQAENVSPEIKKLARRTEEEWKDTLKGVISYLYKKKASLMYGESLEPDHFSGVKIYHANSYADKELPWLRKEDINEVDYFDEGLFGASTGAVGGAALALTIGSLSAVFKIHPRVFTGVAAGLGAIIGHFIQKHYFIDFTNYVKLKRYIEYEPESYELIIELMQKNATKFKEKDPIKYKKIIANLKRLQKNAPQAYKSYLDDEIEAEYDDDPGMFDVYDDGELVKRGTSELTFGYTNDYKDRDRKSHRSSRRLGRSSDYTTRDLGDAEDLERELDQMIRNI